MDRKLPTKHLIVLGLLVTALSACDEAPEVRAALSLELDEMVYELRDDDRNTYHHTRRFVESAGIGVTLTKGVVCVEERCVEAKTNYRIEPNSSFIQAGHFVATLRPTDVITIEYSGIDDAGQPVVVKRTLNVSGAEFTIE